MKRNKNDRDFWYEFPASPAPGNEYWWDGDNGKWVHIEDNDDMSWVIECLMNRDANPDKKVANMSVLHSGKAWKEILNNPKLKTLEGIREYCKQRGIAFHL